MCVCSFVPLPVAPSDKLQFEMELALVCSQSWVQAAKHLVMWNGGTCIIHIIQSCVYMVAGTSYLSQHRQLGEYNLIGHLVMNTNDIC